MNQGTIKLSMCVAMVVLLVAAPALAGKNDAISVQVTVASDEPETSEARAIARARTNAVEVLLPRVRDVARAMGRLPTDESMRRIIAAEIAGGEIVVDESVRKESKSYGEIFYATVNIDASRIPLKRMAERAVSAARREANEKFEYYAVIGGGAAALLAFTTLFYLAANSFTRGYYQGRLRVVALTVIGLGAAATAWLV